MLDIASFSNALLEGNVSFLHAMNVRPFRHDDSVVHFSGEDAVVYPLGTGGETPRYALRLPIEEGRDSAWPSHYADIASVGGNIAEFLPTGITTLDISDLPGVDVALLYDWIPGESLTRRVTRARNRHDRDLLSELMWPLADIGEALRVSGMVHGDIAPGNIIVRRDGGMALVDLDLVGFRGNEDQVDPRRRPGYRLPRAGGSPVEEDAFALLVLMATCGILADSNVPIEHEESSEAAHPMLLFTSWDLMDPQRSRLVRDIEHQLSPISASLLELLKTASTGPNERVPGILREAIQRIRRSGPVPLAEDVSGYAHQDTWRPAVETFRDNPAPDTNSQVEAEAPAEDDHDQATMIGRSWPAAPPAGPAAPRARRSRSRSRDVSTDQIIASIKSIATDGANQASENRRAARAARRQEAVAKELRQALETDDRKVLIRLAMSGALAELGDSDRGELLQVVRALAHDSISRAIARDDDGMIVAAIDESVFQSDSDLDPAFQDRVRLARQREEWTDQMIEAVRQGDARRTAEVAGKEPDGGFARLPESIRRQAQHLIAQREAEMAAKNAINSRDADGLALALGRLVVIQPVWTDHVDPAAVVSLLGEEQIEERLIARFADRKLDPEDQWMVDVVIAEGRLPEATRLSGLTPHDVDRLIYRET